MKRLLPVLSFAALSLLVACQGQHSPGAIQFVSGRIIGGENTTLRRVPWQVSIRDAKGHHFCGGSIIGKRLIITAAHCLDHVAVKDVTVAGGGRSNDVGAQRLLGKVAEIIVHPGWTGGYAEPVNHDIALIKLQSDIIFDAHTKAIHLPTDEHLNFSISQYFTQLPSNELVASGWGNTQTSVQDQAHLKLYEVQPLASARDPYFWDEHTRYQYIVVDLGRRMLGGNFLVSYTEGKSTCSGDSGGPLALLNGSLVDHPVLIGLTSAGGDGGCHSSVFHTDVQQYLGWIGRHL